MKHMNIVVSAIIIAAVLVTAYAVGLLVRHARMDDKPSEVVPATEDVNATLGQQAPGGRYGDKTSAQMRQQREQMFEKMKNMTGEEKRRFMEEHVRNRFGASGGRKQPRRMSPEEREQLMQKLQTMSEEEKRALGGWTPEGQATGDQPPREDTETQPDSGPGGSDPGTAGQG